MPLRETSAWNGQPAEYVNYLANEFPWKYVNYPPPENEKLFKSINFKKLKSITQITKTQWRPTIVQTPFGLAKSPKSQSKSLGRFLVLCKIDTYAIYSSMAKGNEEDHPPVWECIYECDYIRIYILSSGKQANAIKSFLKTS